MTQHFVGGTDVEIVPILADAAELPLDAGSADLVYTVNVYHELDDPLAVLKEALRVTFAGRAHRDRRLEERKPLPRGRRSSIAAILTR